MLHWRMIFLLSVVLIYSKAAVGAQDLHAKADAYEKRHEARLSPEIMRETALRLLARVQNQGSRFELTADPGFQADFWSLVIDGTEAGMFEQENDPFLANITRERCVCGPTECIRCEPRFRPCPPLDQRIGVRCANWCGTCGYGATEISDEECCEDQNCLDACTYCSCGVWLDVCQMFARFLFCRAFFNYEIMFQHQGQFVERDRITAVLQRIISLTRYQPRQTVNVGTQTETNLGEVKIPADYREAHPPSRQSDNTEETPSETSLSTVSGSRSHSAQVRVSRRNRPHRIRREHSVEGRPRFTTSMHDASNSRPPRVRRIANTAQGPSRSRSLSRTRATTPHSQDCREAHCSEPTMDGQDDHRANQTNHQVNHVVNRHDRVR